MDDFRCLLSENDQPDFSLPRVMASTGAESVDCIARLNDLIEYRCILSQKLREDINNFIAHKSTDEYMAEGYLHMSLIIQRQSDITYLEHQPCISMYSYGLNVAINPVLIPCHFTYDVLTDTQYQSSEGHLTWVSNLHTLISKLVEKHQVETLQVVRLVLQELVCVPENFGVFCPFLESEIKKGNKYTVFLFGKPIHKFCMR